MSCHTRYGDLAGLVFPVYQFDVQKLSTGADDVAVVQNFLKRSCVPPQWQYIHLHRMQHSENCNLGDMFAGGAGVIQGLRSGQCNIGFVDDYAQKPQLSTAVPHTSAATSCSSATMAATT